MTRTLNISLKLRHRAPADQPQRLRRVEPAVVKGAPRNGAGELARARLQQGAYVFERCQSARRDHRNGNRFARARSWRRD